MMENHKGKSAPIVKEFGINEAWMPMTPMKPHLGPIYENGEVKNYWSRLSQQNNHAQTLLSYSVTSAEANNGGSSTPSRSNLDLWDDGSMGGGRINLERDNVGETERRGLEEYLRTWNSQGKRTKTIYPPTNPAPATAAQSSTNSRYPDLSSWEASLQWRHNNGGVRDGENGAAAAILDQCTISYANLLARDDTTGLGIGNAAIFQSSDSNQHLGYNSNLYSNSMFSSLFEGEMHNCASPNQYKGVYDASSSQTPKHANGKNSNFAPATPDSRWRIDNDVALGNSPYVTYQRSKEQEQVAAAVMINLQKNHEVEVSNAEDSSSGKVSIAVENHNPVNGGDQVIDLNMTPQKKPRRRKYTPKVLKEKKPRQTQKPKTPKATDSKETKKVKRKYVRKNKENTPSATLPEEATGAGEPTPTGAADAGDTKPTETVAKSCKRSLNFDLNGQVAESNYPLVSSRDVYAMPQPNKCDAAGISRQGEEKMAETSKVRTAYDLNYTQNQELKNYLTLATKDYLDNSQPDLINLSRSKEEAHQSLLGYNSQVSPRNDTHLAQSPNSSPSVSSNEQRQTRGSKRSNSCMTYNDDGNMAAAAHSTYWQPNHIFSGDPTIGEIHKFLFPEICKKKRTEKTQRPHISSMPSTGAPSEDVKQVAGIQNHPRFNPSSSKYYYNPAPHRVNAVAHSHPELLMGSVESRMELMDTWADLARLKKKKRSKGTTRVRDLAPLQGLASVLPPKPGPKGPRKKKTPVSEHAYTEAQAADSAPYPKSKRGSRKQKSSSKQWDVVLYDVNQSTRKTTGSIPALPRAKTSTSSIEEITEGMKLLDINREGCNTSLREWNPLVPYRARKQAKNELVVYGRDGTMAPFDPIKKQRQRAKVDLDDETTKVWKLLLENIDNKGVDGTDEEKAKWWENERSVFHGRVDSFIARMRLVQGDRRFTPWKGSVLDSVIGVFLTQNVSDHLSSSAFMSMAAHFPLKSEGSESTISEESTTALVVEQDVFIIEPEESNTWNEKAKDQQTLSGNPRIIKTIDLCEEKEVVNSKKLTGQAPGSVSPKDYSSESTQKNPNNSIVNNANSQTTDTEIASVLGDGAKDDATSSQHSVVSSQNSTNSPNLQTVETMNLFSEGYSGAQPLKTHTQSNYFDCSTSFLGLLRMAESPFLQESYSQAQNDPFECINHVTKVSPEAQGVYLSENRLNLNYQLSDTKGIEMLEVESRSPDTSRKDENSTPTEQSNLTTYSIVQNLVHEKSSDSIPSENMRSYVLEGETMVMQSERQSLKEPLDTVALSAKGQTSSIWKRTNLTNTSQVTDVTESTTELKRESKDHNEVEQISVQTYASGGISDMVNANASKSKGKTGKAKSNAFDWDSLRRDAQPNGFKKERTTNTRDSLDWEAVRHADVSEIAETIKERGMNNMLAERIKDLLDRLVKDHGSIDMEWLRDIPPDKAKEYLLSFRGLGLKSVECVRLLTLHHLAFPVDTNVGRIAVRLGWVPLQPLPESLQLHLLEMYPILESIQKYLWPRLCKLDQKTLYELHYHLITFGKVFCTKRQPNCNACPLRGECRHFASAFASARFALPGPEGRSIIPSSGGNSPLPDPQASINYLPLPSYSQSNCVNGAPQSAVSSYPLLLPPPQAINHLERQFEIRNCEPIVEIPASPEPEPEQKQTLCDIEDTLYEDPDEIPTIELNMKEFTQTLQNYWEDGRSNALVALTAEAASIPTPKLKNINRLRTEHHVYELPDTHPLLKGLDKREPDDPCSYLLAIWTPGETANSIEPPDRKCHSEDPGIQCNEETCSYCNSQREADSQIVRGTLLIPCRTAMRGSFPLNGTYFQVNEVFADHDSSLIPIAVPRSWLWDLPRRTVYFGTSIPTIFRGLTTEDIQHCFWRGFVCVRGFDQKRRAPRPLMARLHFPASRMTKGARGKAYDE